MIWTWLGPNLVMKGILGIPEGNVRTLMALNKSPNEEILRNQASEPPQSQTNCQTYINLIKWHIPSTRLVSSHCCGTAIIITCKKLKSPLPLTSNGGTIHLQKLLIQPLSYYLSNDVRVIFWNYEQYTNHLLLANFAHNILTYSCRNSSNRSTQEV